MRAARWAWVAAALLGGVFGLHTIADPDLHQQIAVGRAILADPSSIGTSSFTYTYPGFPYVEDKWLASVLVALVDRWGGIDALMIYQLALCALVAVAWFHLMRVWGSGASGAMFGTSLLLVAAAFRLEPRPDTWSHAFLALTMALLGSRVALRRAAPALIGLLVLWVNMHGYFVNGILAIAAAVVAAAYGDPRGPFAAADRRVAWVRGGAVLAGCIAACALHPQGIAAATWPVRQLLLLRSEPALRTALTEFTPSLELLAGGGPWHLAALVVAPCIGLILAFVDVGRNSRVRVCVGSAIALIVVAAPPLAAAPWPYRLSLALWAAGAVEAPRAARERRLFPAFVFAGFSVLAIPMIRNLSLVPPAAVILLAPAWSQAIGEWSRARIAKPLAIAVVVSCVAVSAWARVADHLAPGTYRAPGWTGWGLARDRFPEGAAVRLADSEFPAEILNNFDTSGYLLSRVYPARRAFIVDNTSMYPATFLQEYRAEIMAGTLDPEEIHERWGVNTVVVDHAAMETAGLLRRLARSSKWSLAALDRAAAVWVRVERPAQNIDIASVVTRLTGEPVDRSPLPPWLAPRARVFPALNLGIFLRAIERPDLAMLEADRLWEGAPSFEVATFSAAAREESGRLPEAIPRLELARDRFGSTPVLDDWLARALFVRGVARLEGRAINDARSDFRTALDLAPRSGGPALALARLELSIGNPDDARRWLARALESDDRARMVEAVRSDPLLGALRDALPPTH